MKLTKPFINKYLLPIILIVVVFSTTILSAVMTDISPGTWRFYLLIIVLVLLALLLFMVIRQVLADVAAQQATSERLDVADEKYKSLLETSAEGTLVILDRKIEYANFVFMAMSGYTLKELTSMNFEDLIRGKENSSLLLENLYDELGEAGRTLSLEARISCKRGDMREVVLALSKVRLMDKDGFILITKDMSGRERIEQESLHLRNELHSSILMMNLPIASFAREYISCDMDTSVREAALQMKKKNQDALIITKNGSHPVGILTDSDLRNRVLAEDRENNIPVFEIMSSPIIRISDQSLLYEGILRIQKNAVSHLVVEDRNGNLSGIFSNNDLIDVQRNSISYLIREVSAAQTVESLKKIHNKIPVLVKILMESGARIRNVTYMISTVADAITHRLIEFAIEEMGNPPASFAFLALGSEGRREQTLVTDQDNAIVIEDVPNEKFSEVNRYFLYFGKKINLWLDKIGYQYCKGEIMAGNPQWCQPLSRWKSYFSNWVGEKSEDGILGAAIFFDFRMVYGEEQLAKELRQHIHKTVTGDEMFFHFLAKEVTEYNIPVNIFRDNGATPAGSIPESFNVKNAISPLTGFARVYALQNKISECNTLQRLEKLLRLNIIPENEYQELENIFCRLMEIRFRSQVSAILANRAPDNMVEQEELTAIEQTLIRKAFSEIIRFQEMIVGNFA